MRLHLRAAVFVALLFSPVWNACARETPIQEHDNRTEILFLGTSPGPPLHVDRSKSATLLIVDGREYLFDCGIGTINRMVEAGIDSDHIKTIFLTHLHADHDMGLSDVMANDFFRAQGAPDRVDIYGPPGTRKLVDYAFRYVSIGFEPFAAESWPFRVPEVNGAFPNPFSPHEFGGDGVVFQDDKIRVVAAENSHYALMPARYRQRLKSYAFRVETPHGVIVFTGDTGPSNAVVRLAQGADVLVSEATYRDPDALGKFVNSQALRLHWSPDQTAKFRINFESQHLDTEEVGEIASKAGVGAVLLYHYSPASKADETAYVAGVHSHFRGPVFAPDDLNRFCLKRNSSEAAAAVQLC